MSDSLFILDEFLRSQGWDGKKGDAGTRLLTTAKEDHLLRTWWSLRPLRGHACSLSVWAQLGSARIDRIVERMWKRKIRNAALAESSRLLTLDPLTAASLATVFIGLKDWANEIDLDPLIESQRHLPLSDAMGQQVVALACLVHMKAIGEIDALVRGKQSGQNKKLVPAIKLELLERARDMAAI